jgi:hypothetical protein
MITEYRLQIYESIRQRIQNTEYRMVISNDGPKRQAASRFGLDCIGGSAMMMHAN